MYSEDIVATERRVKPMPTALEMKPVVIIPTVKVATQQVHRIFENFR